LATVFCLFVDVIYLDSGSNSTDLLSLLKVFRDFLS
jgi:hypothetical protein